MSWADQRIVFVNLDGSVGVVMPCWNARLVLAVYQGDFSQVYDPPIPAFHIVRECTPEYLAMFEKVVIWAETWQVFLSRISDSDVPEELPRSVFHKDDLPPRRWRDCWTILMNGGGVPDLVFVDMTKAREVVLAEVRAKRTLLLDESDRHKARLDDVGTPAQKKAVLDYRQALRDFPEEVDRAISEMTADELAKYEPQFPALPAFALPPKVRKPSP